MFRVRHLMSSHFTSPRQRQVNERSAMLRLQSRSADRSTPGSDIERKQKSRMVSFRVAEDDFFRLDALARQTSCSRAEVLRRCLRGARLKSTVDAQALHEVSRVHANLNRVGGLSELLGESTSQASTAKFGAHRHRDGPTERQPRPKAPPDAWRA